MLGDGFTGLQVADRWGFCLGLIETFLYDVYAGLVFVPIYHFFTRRWGVLANQ